jgi:2-oxoglutarate ferredoxin oxidoreductase subunit gamma
LKKECRLCGSGGQGIILAGIILAEAAGIHEDKHVTQVQDYGPAARGDSSKTDIVISDEEIYFPKCQELDLLVALSQRAYDKNRSSLKEDGILIVDSNNVRLPVGTTAHRIPMTEIARDKVESPLSVNMVALGAIAAVDNIAKLESVKKSLKHRVPKKTKEQNLAALKAGYEAALGRNSRKKKHKGE